MADVRGLRDGRALVTTMRAMCARFAASLAAILMLIRDTPHSAPDHADGLVAEDEGADEGGEKTLAAVVRCLVSFYEEALQQQVDAEGFDYAGMARGEDEEGLLRVTTLLLGAAVQCEAKGTYIQGIMEMDQGTQSHLMHVVRSIMGGGQETEDEEDEEADGEAEDGGSTGRRRDSVEDSHHGASRAVSLSPHHPLPRLTCLHIPPRSVADGAPGAAAGAGGAGGGGTAACGGAAPAGGCAGEGAEAGASRG